MKFVTKCNIDSNVLVAMFYDILFLKNTMEYKEMWLVMHVTSFARG